ncbi:glutamate--tRNA ligase [Halorussus salilacus]|uniref:glutamate--tRNA ligase n=1 Tax=Halorussus salilacus TaxID=2953750 RepID=UPI0020A04391|nr:glutamate--tRNA ligase [Halorussus salilacus]USZ67947.1 glutamate--tRNA ligase [Halorussus salilacus]
MNDELRERIETEAEIHALVNAVKHDSDADVGAVMGPLMGENPDFRQHGDEIPGVIGPVVSRVNGLDADERRDRLAELAPEWLAELESEDEGEDHPLPDLPNAEEYDDIRMRCAPNPNGPWHIGHARMPAVIGTYADRYDGEFIVRFDDTDPETKRPMLWAYDEILEEVEYLGFEPAEVYRASDRLDIYYDHARDLIEKGGAYTCSCSGEEFSDLKNSAEPCPHREKDPETTMAEFEAMVDGEHESGEMVLRVKTDIEHKNPALRDWVAFRIIDTPHPREEAEEFRCWPMLDFQSGVDDHLTGVTHIIRGIDLQDSAKRQRFVYDYFDWEYPEVVHWGHVQVDEYDVKMSTSTIRELIEDGELDGWDDPRAPTIPSVRRRGIRGEALVNAMVELGTSTSNVDLAMSSVYANNRELVDDEADRYFFVREPHVDFTVTGDAPDSAHPPVHPDHEDRGTRDIDPGNRVRIEEADVPADGERVWLKGFGCFRRADDELDYVGDDISAVREEGVDVIHWVPADSATLTQMRRKEGDVVGYAEPGFREADPDEMVQFERVGFARVDRQEADDETVVYFAHE